MRPTSSRATPSRAAIVTFYSDRLGADDDDFVEDSGNLWGPIRGAMPLFPDHHQPRIPTTFGYYDPTDLEVHERQFALAVSNGLRAFCYDFPWHPDREHRDTFVERVAKRIDVDVRYVIAWRPTSNSDSLTVEARWPTRPVPAKSLVAGLESFFTDERYLRINGRPILIVKSWTRLKGLRELLDAVRALSERLGWGRPVIAGEEVDGGPTALACGFDLAVPDYALGAGWGGGAGVISPRHPGEFAGKMIDYARGMNDELARQGGHGGWIRAAVPSWDDSPVAGRQATIATGASVDAFQTWVARILEYTYVQNHPDHWIVFAGAWNAWRQDNYLEPDLDFDDTRLRAVGKAAKVTDALACEVMKALGESSDLLAVARRHAAGSAALARQLLAHRREGESPRP